MKLYKIFLFLIIEIIITKYLYSFEKEDKQTGIPYSMQILRIEMPAVITSNETYNVRIIVKNLGTNIWLISENYNLSYHWFDKNGNLKLFEGLRTSLPKDVLRGETIEMVALVKAPDHGGSYYLQWAMVHEKVTWFPDSSTNSISYSVKVYNNWETIFLKKFWKEKKWILLYLLYSAGIYLTLLYCGFGITAGITPEIFKKYIFFLSPISGYIYLTLLSWYLYNLGLKGTDIYYKFILIPPLPITFSVLFLLKKKWRFTDIISKDLIQPSSVTLICFVLISSPYLIKQTFLTSVTLGNNDVASYAANSMYLKEFAKGSGEGFANYIYNISASVMEPVFGVNSITAIFCSLLGLVPYQIINLITLLLYTLGVPLTFLLAHDCFKYSYLLSTVIAGISILNTITTYMLYHVFLAQSVAVTSSLGIFLIYYCFLKDSRKINQLIKSIPLSIMLIWAMAITYPHMLPLVFALVLFSALMLSIHNKSAKQVIHILILISTGLIGIIILSPGRMSIIIKYFIYTGIISAGWSVPFLLPDIWYGLNFTSIMGNVSFIRLIFSMVIIFYIIYGFLKVKKDNYSLFIICYTVSASIIGGYLFLSIIGKPGKSLGGYKSFKYFSFFLPVILCATLSFLKNFEKKWKYFSFIFISLYLFLLVGKFTFELIYKSKYTEVTKEIIDLKELGMDKNIRSINIIHDSYWSDMWAAYFLMRKDLYFERKTYYPASPELKGDWNLVTNSRINISVLKNIEEEHYWSNKMYILNKLQFLNENDSELVIVSGYEYLISDIVIQFSVLQPFEKIEIIINNSRIDNYRIANDKCRITGILLEKGKNIVKINTGGKMSVKSVQIQPFNAEVIKE